MPDEGQCCLADGVHTLSPRGRRIAQRQGTNTMASSLVLGKRAIAGPGLEPGRPVSMEARLCQCGHCDMSLRTGATVYPDSNTQLEHHSTGGVRLHHWQAALAKASVHSTPPERAILEAHQ